MLNPLNFITKLIKSSNQKELDKLKKIVELINSKEDQIAKLQNDEFAREGKGNFQTLFSEVVSSVGATVQSAELNLQSAEMIRDAAENAASELSGVNMDDEAAQLIEYQQAYQASARVLQTARELFDTLIDRI